MGTVNVSKKPDPTVGNTEANQQTQGIQEPVAKAPEPAPEPAAPVATKEVHLVLGNIHRHHSGTTFTKGTVYVMREDEADSLLDMEYASEPYFAEAGRKQASFPRVKAATGDSTRKVDDESSYAIDAELQRHLATVSESVGGDDLDDDNIDTAAERGAIAI